ncbi:hypothetical protein ETU08_04885 [Apibacter muscae]|uniref:hypothetical protein n=1 Tax=Apibacter muscae TaxID=2509004 RepID=UPI0011ABC9BC|nr:hypothetical protein [Apibacter muscae]TWP30434.1 hypothetical protein ETU08_04885 [Apibacter muscae]
MLKIIILIASSFIPLIIISILIIQKDAWFTPRTLIGFPFFIYPLLILINFYSEKLCKYISITFIIISLPLMAVYANSLKNQNKFEEFLIKDIYEKIDIHHNNKNIAFYGVEPWAPEIEIPINNFPII